MREVVAHRDYRLLFSAQVVALIGTGLLGVLAVVLSFTTTALAWPAVLALWFGLGTAISAVLTPAGRVIRRAVCLRSAPPPRFR